MPISRRARSDQELRKEQDFKDALRASVRARDAALASSAGGFTHIGYTSGGIVRGSGTPVHTGTSISVHPVIDDKSLENDAETALRLTKSAPQLYALYSKFVDQGFTEDQAMRCVLATIRGLREEAGE